MEPISIVTLSGGVVQLCYKIARSIYILAKDVQSIEENLNSLAAEVSSISRTVKAVTTTINDPQLGFGAISQVTASNQDIWSALFGSVEDLRKTLERLRTRVAEVTPTDQTTSLTVKMARMIELKISQDYISRVRSSLHTHQLSLNTALLMIQLYAQAQSPRERQTNLWPDITRLKRMADSLPSSNTSIKGSTRISENSDTILKLRKAAFKVASNASDTAGSRTQSLTSSYARHRVEEWVNFSEVIDEGAEKDPGTDQRQNEVFNEHERSQKPHRPRAAILPDSKAPKRPLYPEISRPISKTLSPLPNDNPTSTPNERSIPLLPFPKEATNLNSCIAQPITVDRETSGLGIEAATTSLIPNGNVHDGQSPILKSLKTMYAFWLFARCVIGVIQLALVIIVCALGGGLSSESTINKTWGGTFIDPSSAVGAVVLGAFSGLYALILLVILYQGLVALCRGRRKSTQRKDDTDVTSPQETTTHKGRWKPSPYPLFVVDFCFGYVLLCSSDTLTALLTLIKDFLGQQCYLPTPFLWGVSFNQALRLLF